MANPDCSRVFYAGDFLVAQMQHGKRAPEFLKRGAHWERSDLAYCDGQIEELDGLRLANEPTVSGTLAHVTNSGLGAERGKWRKKAIRNCTTSTDTQMDIF